VFNRIAFGSGIRQKRKLLQSFVREAAAAGLLPGKLFVEEMDVPATRRQQRSCQSARWTASDNRNGVLHAHVRSRISPHRKQARQRATTFRRRSRAFYPRRDLAGIPANP
jgi:hypothetical protein